VVPSFATAASISLRIWKPNSPRSQDFGPYAQALPTSLGIAYWESTDGYEWVEQSRTPIGAPNQSGLDGSLP